MTAVQIVAAFAAIANGGRLMQPQIVRAVLDVQGREVRGFEPKAVRQVISPETARDITTIMTAAVREGTGHNAAIPGYEVYRQNGHGRQELDPATRRYSPEPRAPSLVGFAPADEPRLAMLVMLDEPRNEKWGSEAAAPILRPCRDHGNTNGKTTTSYLVEAILASLEGLRTGVIGTIQYVLGDERRPAARPPKPSRCNRCWPTCAITVFGASRWRSRHTRWRWHASTSLTFDIAMFTNLTQDHLDFHGTFEAYRATKRRLFELLARSGKPRPTAVVNADDPSGAEMTRGLALTVLTFGLGEGADVRALRHESALDGIRLIAGTPRGRLEIETPLVGDYNLENLAIAVGMAVARGLPADAIACGAAAVDRPRPPGEGRAGRPSRRGRLRPHPRRARARDRRARAALTRGARARVVFGCGGDRDRSKRPRMGRIVAGLADLVVDHVGQPPHEDPRGHRRRDRRGALRGRAGPLRIPTARGDRRGPRDGPRRATSWSWRARATRITRSSGPHRAVRRPRNRAGDPERAGRLTHADLHRPGDRADHPRRCPWSATSACR